jgi:hypothetical protein
MSPASAGVGAPAAHSSRATRRHALYGWTGGGWWRRWARQVHEPAWYAIVAGGGRTLYACAGHRRCIETLAT